MRLRHYLTEFDISYLKDVTILDNYLNQIKKTAKPWIRQAGDYAIFRGLKNTSLVMRKKVRTNRVPKDTKRIEHEIVDKAFFNKFGWRPRSSGLFVVGDAITASGYGHLMLIFPIGKVSYLYSDSINDLYMSLKGMRWSGTPEVPITQFGHDIEADKKDDDPRNIASATPEEINSAIIDQYTDKGIRNLARSTARQPEIMINCKEYWAIDVKIIIDWMQWKEIPFPKGGIDMYSREMYSTFIKEAILK